MRSKVQSRPRSIEARLSARLLSANLGGSPSYTTARRGCAAAASVTRCHLPPTTLKLPELSPGAPTI